MRYNHLTIEERSCIYQFFNLGMSIRKIGKALRRSPSTISREIKRNSSNMEVRREKYTTYFPIKVNEKYIDRRKESHRKSKFSKDALDYVSIKINEHWSPEQISNRMTEFIVEKPSISTIYRMIHCKKATKNEHEKVEEERKI